MKDFSGMCLLACLLLQPRTAMAMLAATASAPLCVFLHGAGSPDSGPPADSDPAYWGRVHELTPQCAERRFMHEDTLRSVAKPQRHQPHLRITPCEACLAAVRNVV